MRLLGLFILSLAALEVANSQTSGAAVAGSKKKKGGAVSAQPGTASVAGGGTAKAKKKNKGGKKKSGSQGNGGDKSPPTLQPGQCYSVVRDHVFDNTDEWTEPGCQRKFCRDGTTEDIPCPVLGEQDGCDPVNGTAGADHPDCCQKLECKCHSEYDGKTYVDGATWTDPPCISRRCNVTTIISDECAMGEPEHVPDPLPVGCTVDLGTPGANHPACCLSANCNTGNEEADEREEINIVVAIWLARGNQNYKK